MSIQPLASHPREISVTEPLTQACDRVKLVLFHPFDPGRWFVIGFCAWLAGLGERGGGYGGNFYNNTSGDGSHVADQFRHVYQISRDFVILNLAWVIPLAAFIVVLTLAISIFILWLNSRGKFMLIHCVALNRAEVEVPWSKHAAPANSLFLFRLLLMVAGMVLFLPVVVIGVVLCEHLFMGGVFSPVAIVPVACAIMGLVLLAILFALVHKFMVDFVVPIMYLRGGSCTAAWGEFFRLCSGHFLDLILYLLFQFVLGIVIGMLVLCVVIFTCCVAGCFMLIPYIGTVLLLPVVVFKRAYSLHYLAQFGPDYNVFPPPPAPPAPPVPGPSPVPIRPVNPAFAAAVLPPGSV